jgi:hypothetical protein
LHIVSSFLGLLRSPQFASFSFLFSISFGSLLGWILIVRFGISSCLLLVWILMVKILICMDRVKVSAAMHRACS